MEARIQSETCATLSRARMLRVHACLAFCYANIIAYAYYIR